MKKFALLLLVIVAGSVGAYHYLNKSDGVAVNKTSDKSVATASAGAYKTKDACSVFNQQDADSVLGRVSKKGEVSASNASSDDIVVSNCLYYVTGVGASSYRSASILVRSPKTKAGANSNTVMFNEQKPAGVQDVENIGDAANWSPEFGQLNVLANDTWYILSVGGTKPAEHTLQDAKVFADVVMSKL